MSGKWTAGSWEAKGAAIFAGKNCIALTDTDNATPEVFQANARIMAAAPELYEALASAAESLEQLVSLNRIPANNKGLRDARAALAKATGDA